jgi:hypothetical protein
VGGVLEVIESIIDAVALRSVAAFGRMGMLKDNAVLSKAQAKCQQTYHMGMLKVKKAEETKQCPIWPRILNRNPQQDQLGGKIGCIGKAAQLNAASRGRCQ